MKRNKGFTLIELMIVLVFVVAALLITVKGSSHIFARGDLVATVTEKGERCSSRDDCRYLIYTDKGTIENTDSWLAWKFDSSDVYGDLKVGHTYHFRTQGIRVPFLSWYPNIMSVRERPTNQ